MIRLFGLRRALPVFLSLLALASALAAPTDRKFTTSTALQAEASTLVGILERAHYNRDNVHSADYAQVIPDYMGELDGQHLFFLATDKTKFLDDYGKSVYYNTAFLGNIDASYRIFELYQTRVEARVNWIFAELNKDFDLGTNETYRVDRSKSEWPATPAAADDLWRRRLKYELIAEILSKKTPENKKSATAKNEESDAAKTSTDAKASAPAATGAPAANAPAATKDVTPATPKADPIAEAKTTLHKRYERMLKNLDEIEGTDLAELYLSTIAHLYDPHSTYFSAATYEDFSIQMKLQLVGIGALLGLEDDTCVVKEIVPGGPADVGHDLKPNDKIISVGQTGSEPVEILGMKLRKIVDMIRGQKGTQVHLLVQPADAPDSSTRKEIVITRDVVKLNAQRARAAVFQIPNGDGKNQPIGVITLPAFYNEGDEGDTDGEKTSASKDVARLIDDLKAEKVQGLVLDLRHNGGGYLNEAIDLAGLFISKGPIVQVKSYNGDITVDEDTNSKIAYDGPLAVLVDRFSASASEIVTGALQNYGRAIVIGDSSTHGKGSVQQVVEMKQLNRQLAVSPEKTGAAKFTIQKYYLPSGASTQLKGVVPDIVLPSIDDYIPNIGESDLPHALVWDQIPTSFFQGSPLEQKVLTPLRQASLDRQSKLEEFTYLKKNVDWFKSRQEQKLVSVNLAERQKQKADDDAFRKEMKVEKEQIAKSDFTFKPFYLGGPPPAKIKAPKKDDDPDDDADLDEENDTYVKADVHLREALRVVNDAVALGRNRDLWASNRPPLTAIISNGG
ncbi:MAG TPA: carboxy terminal-processing peptidase [Opitutaceae bacterium]|nr:carboxy terminal-processing peptidase [Opitutaceae bacterium]